jgi:hypothetical protein
MPDLIIRQQVEDYRSWKAIFDQDMATRRACGSKGSRIFRNTATPNELIILFTWDDLDRARLYFQADDLQIELTGAALFGSPLFWFLEEADNTSG